MAVRVASPVSTVTCDAPMCSESCQVESSDYNAVLTLADQAGWSINDHSRGAWTYCPGHAAAFEGRTPKGRQLIGF